MRQECRYLVEPHEISRIVLLFHGPSPDGRADAVCADYRRKLRWATPATILDRQEHDACELLASAPEWAGNSAVAAYLFQAGSDHRVSFRAIRG